MEIADQPWLGRGFGYELNFINYSGEHITTTHSVYLGSLLKGGIIGFTAVAGSDRLRFTSSSA